MSFRSWIAGAAFAAVALIAGAASAQQSGEQIFNARCKMCHEPPVGQAPSRQTISAMPTAQVVQVLTSGVMVPMASGLSDADKQAVAGYLTGAAPGPVAQAAPAGGANRQSAFDAAPKGVDKMCETHPPITASGKDWTSVGMGDASLRYQPNPGLTAADVAKLKVKWAYSMAGGGMPTVVGDWLFVSNRSGKTYALDAKTGCVHWASDLAARTTPMVTKNSISPSGWITFVGERSRVVHALDAQTGKEIWKTEPLEKHPVAGLTGTPIIHGDLMFVPITSGEEGTARQATYACCSFRGSLVAVDLKTGKKLWQTYMIREPLRPTKANSAGVMMQGPAGAAIWSAPTVDAARGQVLVTTGDSYTVVDTKGADAIVAMDMKTGAIRWSTQVTEKDNFIVGCPVNGTRAANCPDPLGPDHDFGASPILFKMKGGKDVVLAGQKSGAVWGLDAATGKILWERRVGAGSTLGGIEWGMAADGQRLYVTVSDIGAIMDELRAKNGLPLSKTGITGPGKPGLYAIDPATGKVVWSAPAPEAPCTYAGDRSRDRGPAGACMRAQSAAPSVMPGVVFSGTMDGWFRAYDAASGKVIWADSTTSRTYDTVNGVKGQPGGSLDGMGPAIANGMVFTMSGFNGAANTGGNGVNVLLAYSVDGK